MEGCPVYLPMCNEVLDDGVRVSPVTAAVLLMVTRAVSVCFQLWEGLQLGFLVEKRGELKVERTGRRKQVSGLGMQLGFVGGMLLAALTTTAMRASMVALSCLVYASGCSNARGD